MARRLSSIFSLGSNSSNDTRPLSSFDLDRPSRDFDSVHLARNSTPDLRPFTPSRSGQDLYSSQLSNEAHSNDMQFLSVPGIVDDGSLFRQPPQLLKPLPHLLDSPGNRLSSRVNGSDGRPASRDGSRASSTAGSIAGSRSSSPSQFRPMTPTSESKLSKRRSWLPSRSRAESIDESQEMHSERAWIVTADPRDKIDYDLSPLLNFQRVPELWDDTCDTLVYLHNRQIPRGPSFRVDSSLFSSSKKLAFAAHGEIRKDMQHQSFGERVQALTLNAPTSPPVSQRGSSNRSSSQGDRSVRDYFEELPAKKTIHLCIPLPLQADLANPQSRLTASDVESVVTMRNVFAFLAGQPLVATSRHPSMFSIFLEIADVLHRYEFTNIDGSTLGENAAIIFEHYMTDFRFADVRSSREKTIEALILGERMKSWSLYNEGFVHAIGKYDEIAGLGSPKFHQITEITRKRMERAHLDLSMRLRNVRSRLEDFDFPSLFAGIANSSSSSESKIIRFKAWKNSFMSMRKHVMAFYKLRFGAWPPKAKSKKNDFEESGLNRLLLRELYQDFSDLYDVLVDRSALTTRSADMPSQDGPDDDPQEPTPRALRRVMSEYDRSTPPVQPPVPFDTPLLPSLSSTRRDFDSLDLRKQKKESMKKIRDDEINKALMQAYNRDSIKSTPFLEAFMKFERRSARGKSIEEIADLRNGQWIFMYAVLQALPLVVVDAPGVKFTQGVEYFLCEVAKGTAPWVHESHVQKQSWYGIAGSTGMVSLPADIVEHGVDGIYRRSHCWQAAEAWAGHSEEANTAARSPLPYDELLPPVMPSTRGSSASPPSRDQRRASMALGLEQLPLPSGTVPSGSRPLSVHDPLRSFATILAQTDSQGMTKKK